MISKAGGAAEVAVAATFAEAIAEMNRGARRAQAVERAGPGGMKATSKAEYDGCIELAALSWLAAHREERFFEQAFSSVHDAVALLGGVVEGGYDRGVLRRVLQDTIYRVNELLSARLLLVVGGDVPEGVAERVEKQLGTALRKTLDRIAERFPVVH